MWRGNLITPPEGTLVTDPSGVDHSEPNLIPQREMTHGKSSFEDTFLEKIQHSGATTETFGNSQKDVSVSSHKLESHQENIALLCNSATGMSSGTSIQQSHVIYSSMDKLPGENSLSHTAISLANNQSVDNQTQNQNNMGQISSVISHFQSQSQIMKPAVKRYKKNSSEILIHNIPSIAPEIGNRIQNQFVIGQSNVTHQPMTNQSCMTYQDNPDFTRIPVQIANMSGLSSQKLYLGGAAMNDIFLTQSGAPQMNNGQQLSHINPFNTE